ncbi:iron-sulfur cluster assembly accessory protein [Ignatzschineria indica]|uniref:HesB/IscA family protein n=1 Tax=Ignatzschineria indica TaxID=472583 RepID=UPI00257778D1|nr:iron-sulfur cluster assembly accessory protein [Ignatzschineria indica]MDM1545257.1 iron-sulfur cluster assembly accessory protein [Ignatzschineria indica]
MLIVTEAARKQLAKNLGESSAEAIKIALQKSGCSGYKYYIDFCDKVDEKVVVIEETPVKIVAEPDILPYLESVTLDYIQDGINRMFKFQNPEAKAECGCGESFML